MKKPEAEPNYVYRIVSRGGSGILSREFDTEAEAEAHKNASLDKNPAHYGGIGELEVDRVEHRPRGDRQWLKREGEWRHAHYVTARLTREQIREREEKLAKRPPPEGVFIATFTRDHFHPNTGQSLRFARVKFQAASRSDANDLMWEAFGNGWYDAHPIENVRGLFRREGKTPDQVEQELWTPPYFRVPWPTPPTPAGETVTLRVRLTAALAKESSVWLAGRCLLHRADAECPVMPGAGVWTEDGEFPDAWRNQGPERSVLGEGLVLLVQLVPRAAAERAALADPENVSIVPGSESRGTFVGKRYIPMSKPTISGIFSIDALYALANKEKWYAPLAAEASRLADDTGAEEEAYAAEIVNGKVIAIHVHPKNRIF